MPRPKTIVIADNVDAETGAAIAKHDAPEGVDSFLPAGMRKATVEEINAAIERRAKLRDLEERKLLRGDLAEVWDLDYNPAMAKRRRESQIMHIPAPAGRQKI